MFTLSDLKQTRFYQEAFEEGREEGIEQGIQKGRQEGRSSGDRADISLAAEFCHEAPSRFQGAKDTGNNRISFLNPV